jgi:hypothetical protein
MLAFDVDALVAQARETTARRFAAADTVKRRGESLSLRTAFQA